MNITMMMIVVGVIGCSTLQFLWLSHATLPQGCGFSACSAFACLSL